MEEHNGEIPRWQLEGGRRKHASQSKILERCLVGKNTKKRQNSDSSTPPFHE
jgi:hypothetical protein